MKTLSRCVALALGISATLELHGSDERTGIHCVISGATNSFLIQARAVLSKTNGLTMMGFSKDDNGEPTRSIVIHIPFAREGKFTLANTPDISLHYSRSTISSMSHDHHDIRGRASDDNALQVTIRKLGPIGQKVEGEFSGIAKTFRGRDLIITNGSFSLTLTSQ